MSDNLYWHAIPVSGLWAQLFFNNVRVGQGELFSVSLLNEAYRGTADARTGYGNKGRDDPKEQVFEQVRQARFPQRPSRIDCLFLFDDPNYAEMAATRWFAAETRLIVEARLVVGATTHRGDARWLDLAASQSPEDCAVAYWQGELTPDAVPEIIVHGRVFFPRWEEFPTEEEVRAGKLGSVVQEIARRLDQRREEAT